MKRLVLELIKLYQSTVSQVTPPACRFAPTCSHYAYEAIERYGFLKGSWLAAKRLARCHPWSIGGCDPVP
ncbi:MAG: membrane protein insertion efficiency factor YidD [Dehalococcoidia bacterium]